ncbi:hypothetical protein [Acidithiobacillus caldus]|nr:hypothetical protein [Acidithiobacillus caldus]MBU2781328.1 hypothetical protein [Acidithiobacillus caldus]
METLAQAGGHDADYSLVPVRLVRAQNKRFSVLWCRHDLGRDFLRFLANAVFDAATLAVQLVQGPGDLSGSLLILGEQEPHTGTHVFQSPGGIDSWGNDEAYRLGGHVFRLNAGDLQ